MPAQFQTFTVRVLSRAPNPKAEDIEEAKKLINNKLHGKSPVTEETRLLNETTPEKEDKSIIDEATSPDIPETSIKKNTFGNTKRRLFENQV